MGKVSKEEINEAIKLLERSGFIVINPNEEMTVTSYCKKYKQTQPTVSSWCLRGNIEYRSIPELNDLKLVRPGTEKTIKPVKPRTK